MKTLWLWLVLILALSFISAPARADTEPTRFGTTDGNCNKYIMCAAQTATGICDTVGDGTGDEIVLVPYGKWSRFTFYSNESAAAHTCLVESNNTGWDADNDAIVISTTALTATNDLITVFNGDFGALWINCSAITTSVTITVNACSSSR